MLFECTKTVEWILGKQILPLGYQKTWIDFLYEMQRVVKESILIVNFILNKKTFQ